MRIHLARYASVLLTAVCLCGCSSGGRWGMPSLASWRSSPFKSSSRSKNTSGIPTPSAVASGSIAPAPGAGYQGTAPTTTPPSVTYPGTPAGYNYNVATGYPSTPQPYPSTASSAQSTMLGGYGGAGTASNPYVASQPSQYGHGTPATTGPYANPVRPPQQYQNGTPSYGTAADYSATGADRYSAGTDRYATGADRYGAIASRATVPGTGAGGTGDSCCSGSAADPSYRAGTGSSNMPTAGSHYGTRSSQPGYGAGSSSRYAPNSATGAGAPSAAAYGAGGSGSAYGTSGSRYGSGPGNSGTSSSGASLQGGPDSAAGSTVPGTAGRYSSPSYGASSYNVAPTARSQLTPSYPEATRPQSNLPPAGNPSAPSYSPGPSSYTPGAPSSYTPGDTGYAPQGTTPYRSPAAPYTSPMPTNRFGNPPSYRPGSVRSYEPSNSNASGPNRISSGYGGAAPGMGSSVVPADYTQPTGSSYRR